MKYAKKIDPTFVTNYRDKTPPWGPVGYVTYKRTYARMTDAGITEEWWQTVERCCNGLLDINGIFTQDEIQRLFHFVFNLKCNFSGRALWQLGTPTVAKLGGDSLQNCFAGETEVLTSGGVFPIKELIGKPVEVQALTNNGPEWIPTQFRALGKQRLMEVTFADGTIIRATPTHEWLKFENGKVDLHNRIFTQDLMARKRIALPLRYPDLPEAAQDYEEGYAHGFTYGDGTYLEESQTCQVEIFPAKLDMVPLLEGYGDLKGEPTPVIYGLPGYWKRIPVYCTRGYALGFVLGLASADGNVRNTVRIHNKSKEELNKLRRLAQYAGLRCGNPYLDREISPFDGTIKECWCITISTHNLTKDHFIRDDQATALSTTRFSQSMQPIKVVDLGVIEEVYCCNVAEWHNFTLANGVVTGNCWHVAVNDPIDPFTFTFNELMLGGGVGFNITPEYVYELPPVRHAVRVDRVDSYDCDFIVPDNREGWVELLERILKAFFYTGKNLTYCTRAIRPRGYPIKGFGGVASGSEELVKGMAQIALILQSAHGRKLRPVECLDIMNIIGQIVVAGNVRRSAEIALGSPNDLDFINAKNWSRFSLPPWRQQSNNSLIAKSIMGLSSDFWDGYEGKGEPYGLVNLDLCRRFGRLADGPNHRTDPDVVGVNPCITADTWIHTNQGPKQVSDLIGQSFYARLYGRDYQSTDAGFFYQGDKETFLLETDKGYSLTCTKDHGIYTFGHKIPLSDLSIGDSIDIQNHQHNTSWGGKGTFKEGWLMGSLLGDGTFTESTAHLSYWGETKEIMLDFAKSQIEERRSDCGSTQSDRQKLGSVSLLRQSQDFGVSPSKDLDSSKIEATSSFFHRGFLSGWFDADGSVQGTEEKGFSIRLASSKLENLFIAQRMLLRLGILTTVYPERRPEGYRYLPNGHGGHSLYYCQADHELVISGEAILFFHEKIGFIDPVKASKLEEIYNLDRRWKHQQFTARVTKITPIGTEAVYDCTIPGPARFDANGLCVSNCGEITLASHEACNLAELYLPNLDTIEEFRDAAELVYMAVKTISTLPFIHPKTNAIVEKNRRLGIGVTGFCGPNIFRDNPGTFDAVYEHLEDYDKEYSRQLRVNESIKLTTVKPSGTNSLLPGVPPGVHPDFSDFYIRRITFAADDPLVEIARSKGYTVEPKRNLDGSHDLNSMVVDFPIKAADGTIKAKDLTAIQQLENQKFLQTHWSDNSVSMTCYYRPEELPAIQDWAAEHYEDEVKTMSFLRHSGHGFQQAPYEEISAERYAELSSKITPITSLTDHSVLSTLSSQECERGSCPIK